MIEELKKYTWEDIGQLGRWGRGARKGYLLKDKNNRTSSCAYFLKVYEIGRSKKLLREAKFTIPTIISYR